MEAFNVIPFQVQRDGLVQDGVAAEVPGRERSGFEPGAGQQGVCGSDGKIQRRVAAGAGAAKISQTVLFREY